MNNTLMNTEQRHPKVLGPIPGPRSLELLGWQERHESSAVTYPKGIPIAIEQAQGCFVQDVDGNILIDFLSGAGTLNLGASQPEVVEAATRQVSRLTHALDFPTPTKCEFGDRVLGLLPARMRGQMRIHFCGPTGADAVEAAVKIAKSHTQRGSVVSFHGGYHGCTNGAMSLTALRSPKERIRNLMPEVHFFPYSYCYRCPMGLRETSCETNCIGYLEQVLRDTHGGLTHPAAVILEAVQGEGGVIPAKPEFLRRIRALTTELSIPLIVDEIQSGIGRTGKWFAFEHYDIEPDIILCSKALGGVGLPVSVVLYRREYRWEKGAHIGTFRGNQVAFAAGSRALQYMVEHRIVERVAEQSRDLLEQLKADLGGLPCVGDIRGLGFLIGIEIVEPKTMAPNETLARRIQHHCLQRGLIIELGGRHDCVLRLLPPLNTPTKVFDTAFGILRAAVDESLAAAHAA